MRWTETLIPTLRENPQDAEIISHKLMLRGGFIRKLAAGTYSYLPLGYRVLAKVQNIIREEMVREGALEVLLPALQPIELWKKTGRDKDLQDVMIKFRDRHGKITCLGPTHEEVITALLAGCVSSYKDLPKILFQIQTKFRDEIRPRFGVIRSSEFIMKDAYSFDTDEKGLEKSYEKMYGAYSRILERCELPYIAVLADPGVMGGGESHEFMVPAETGEDTIAVCASCGYGASKDILAKEGIASGCFQPPRFLCKPLLSTAEVGSIPRNDKNISKNAPKCPKCGKAMELKHAIEMGHTFKLGAKYSKPLSAAYLDAGGKSRDIIMGCYGIGVNRIPAAAIESHNDKDGIIWPKSIAPYEIALLPLNAANENLRKFSEELYGEMVKAGLDVIIDDRPERAGVKFKDADLIGFPAQVVIGEKNLEEGKAEIKTRKDGKAELVDRKDIIKILKGEK